MFSFVGIYSWVRKFSALLVMERFSFNEQRHSFSLDATNYIG